MNWVPTLADAEEYVRRKEERTVFAQAMIEGAELVRRLWLASDEYKQIVEAERLHRIQLAKAKRAQETQLKIREAMARADAQIRKKKLEAERKKARAIHERDKAAIAKLIAERKAHLERSRRSRIDWSELIDNPVTVERQIQWERRMTALAMQKAGLSYRVIGERLGVTRSRAAQVVKNAIQSWKDQTSPAEAYMNAETHKEVVDLHDWEVKAARPKPPRQPSRDWLFIEGV